MAAGTSIWSTFPVADVFPWVLACVEDRRDLAAVNLVSRAWHEGVHRHLSHLGPLDYSSSLPARPCLARPLELYTGLRALTLHVRVDMAGLWRHIFQDKIRTLAAHPSVGLGEFGDAAVTQSIRPLGSLTRLQALSIHGTDTCIGELWRNDTALALFSDLTGLTHLHLTSGGAQRNLEVLRRMPLLQDLVLQVHPAADGGPLFALRHLSCLDLQGASDPSMQSVSKLTSLQRLRNFHIPGKTVCYLSALTGLTDLHLQSKHGAVSLAPLQRLHQLQRLHLEFWLMADLSPLSLLTKLRTIKVNNACLLAHDALPLAGLPGLDRFHYSGGELLHASCLGGLSTLQHLELFCEGLSDLMWLSKLTGLRSIHLDHSLEAKIDSLAALVGLTAVTLTGASDDDMVCLVGLTGLQSLYIVDSLITDVDFVSNLQRLECLDLRNAKDWIDISALQVLPALRDLSLKDCRFDWSAVAVLTALENLNLMSTTFDDVSLISRLTNLRSLDVWATPIGGRSTEIRQTLPNLAVLRATNSWTD